MEYETNDLFEKCCAMESTKSGSPLEVFASDHRDIFKLILSWCPDKRRRTHTEIFSALCSSSKHLFVVIWTKYIIGLNLTSEDSRPQPKYFLRPHNLKSLNIVEKITPLRTLEEIGKITTLTSLSFKGLEALTIETVPHLLNLKMLKSLNIRGTDIFALEELTKLQQLTSLALPESCTPNPSLDPFSHFRELIFLDLTSWTLIDLTPIYSLKLRELVLNRTFFKTNDIFKGISQLKCLTRLEIAAPGATDGAMNHVSELTQLRKLKVFRRMTQESGSQLAALTNLTYLDFGFCPYPLIEDISALKQLKTLKAPHRNNFTHHTVKSLMHLDHIQHLDIGRAFGLTDNFLLQLIRPVEELGFRPLKSLRIERNDLTDKGMEVIAKLTSLKSLDLEGASNPNGRITDVGIGYFTALEVGFCQSLFTYEL